MDELTPEQQEHMRESGYYTWRHTDAAGWIAVNPLAFTWAICCHVDPNPPDGHFPYRYCYDSLLLAMVAFDEWDGTGHPPGPWIKRKGIDGDLANPNTPKQPWDLP